MDFLSFLDKSELETLNNDLSIKLSKSIRGLENGFYFVPNLESAFNENEKDFENNLSVSDYIYFWGLILRDNPETNIVCAIIFDLPKKCFPVQVHVDLNKDVALELSAKIRDSNSISYGYSEPFDKVLEGIGLPKFVIEAVFEVNNISGLIQFIEYYFDSGGIPWHANSFFIRTATSIPKRYVKEIIML